MHGREGEEWTKRRRHMWPVPSAALAASVTDAHDSANADALDYFCKDGRKISVGDCALFKPPQETSPPFIGIIRQLTSGKEDYLKLGVNWLYRPADIKLGKGIVPEAAPNEIFYSFHKDEIPAASLLHPCKVAFLRKGVELPPGISSFVCRRVYDTTHKRLWWLTDQDYINERQEEVDQLLDKTRLEMNATVQSGGRSPKPLNGPTTPQLKPGSDGVQNSSTSFPSQGKGKKRGDRVDQGPELVKRERSSKTEDSNSGHFKSESMLKSEIAKITDKGGLVDYDGVEKLVQLMQTDRVEKKIDLAGRIMLADVIAATDRYDCLGKFLQLRGVSVLDEWLQEVHKGKIGDGASIKESDKSVEEFLLALLRALDKLPVNLDALQNCNVGKSVNHLRSHKNFEIQKKARGLVETWKKRVEAEWDINDAKSGSNQAVSWPSKSGFPEVSHGGGRLTGGSVETTMKNSVAQLPGSKTAPVKIGHGDSASKLTSALSGSPKVSVSLPTVVAISRDSPGKVAVSSATSDLPSTTVREEKSSSSSQSPNNSQSCSSDHAKTMSSSWKEDGRGSTAGSMNVNKTSGASRHRKSNNGVLGSAVSGVQKETCLVKCCSLDRKATSEKHSQSGLTCDRTHDASLGDHGNNQRLIVRLPNLGRSPARSASGGSFDDPSTTVSRASSPGLAEKHEHCEKKGKVKSEACRTNISADLNGESWQRNAVKDGSIGSDEGNGSLVAVLDEEHDRTGDDIDKALEASKTTSSAPGNHKNAYLSESKPGKLHEASLRSINVLIDSCIKNSEANASVPAADDRGMNLLASVAAGEMSKSDLVSPIGSPGRSSPAPEDSPSGDGSKLRFSCEDDAGQSQGQYPDDAGLDPEKLQTKGGAPHITAHGHAKVPGNSKIMSSEEKPADEQSSQVCTSSLCLQQGSSPCLNTDGQPDEKVTVAAAVPPADVVQEEDADGEGDAKLHEKRKTVAISSSGDSIHDSKSNVRSPLLDESKDFDQKDEKIVDLCKSAASGMVHSSVSETDHTVSRVKVEKETKDLASCPPLERGGESNDIIPEDSGAAVSAESKHSSLMNCNVATEVSAKDIVLPSVSNVLDPTNVDELKSDNAVLVETNAHVEPSENQRVERGIAVPSVADDSLVSEALDQNAHVMDNSDKKEVLEHHTSGSAPQQESNTALLQETRQGLKSSGAEADGAKDCASAAEATSMSGVAGSDTAAKLDIDLNEGFPVDEGSQVDQVSSVGPGSSSIHLPGPLPFPLSSMSSSLPSSITVAAAAKGRFILPENLTRNKGEIGWKGSAATSAFRPAEPRKVLEMPLATTDPLLDIAAAKQGRPPLDIDLNVPDERVLEDMASHSSAQEAGSESGLVSIREFGRNEMLGTSAPVRSAGGLDLDLNRVDEATDVGQFSASTSRRTEVPLLSIRASSSSGFSNGEVNVLRNFDLNNGPGLDEVSVEPAPPRPHPKGNVPFLSPVAGIRMNNNEVSSLSSWFSPGSYPGFAVSSILPDRGEHPYPIVATAGTQRILGPSSGGPTFGPDMYRGPVLSSSPAVAFSPATAPFPYPGFPFGTSFPLPSTSFSSGSTLFMDSSAAGGVCFPAVPSPLVGAASAVSSHYPRPYVISVPDGTANGGAEGSRKWGRQGLDLNAGPGGADVEGRDDRLPSSSRQISISSGQALAEDQVRMYQAAGTVLKRKEPEGGWDAERYNYKQPSWQ